MEVVPTPDSIAERREVERQALLTELYDLQEEAMRVIGALPETVEHGDSYRLIRDFGELVRKAGQVSDSEWHHYRVGREKS